MEKTIRHTAYKVWIKDLHSNEYGRQEGEFESGYVLINNNRVSRANIIASVIQKFESEDKNYVSVTVDDGSDTIRLKTWREDTSLLNNFNIGDLVLVIGKVKKFNEEIYIMPEIVKIVDPNWLLVRKAELIKEYGGIVLKQEKILQNNLVVEEETIVTSNKRQNVLNVIEKLDNEEGVEINKILEETKNNEGEVKEVIDELIRDGEIYEIAQGRIRILK